MDYFNKFTIVGRLTKDPELKESANGTKYVHIAVATEANYKDKNGKQKVYFPNFTLWNKNAERIVEEAKKGSLITLEGRLEPKKIETNNNQIVYYNEAVIEKYKHLCLSHDNYLNEDSKIETESTEEMAK